MQHIGALEKSPFVPSLISSHPRIRPWRCRVVSKRTLTLEKIPLLKAKVLATSADNYNAL